MLFEKWIAREFSSTKHIGDIRRGEAILNVDGRVPTARRNSEPSCHLGVSCSEPLLPVFQGGLTGKMVLKASINTGRDANLQTAAQL